MITFVRGKLVEAKPTQVIIDVSGVGYEALIPISSYDKLPEPGKEVLLLTHLSIREDAHVLYGFMTSGERDLFRLLISSVSGIGPKIALNALNGMTVTAFRGAISNGDTKAISRISGIGKKTAERIVVELRDKIGPVGGYEAAAEQREEEAQDAIFNDSVMALEALGIKQNDAVKSVRAARAALGNQAKVEEVVRACLKQLQSK